MIVSHWQDLLHGDGDQDGSPNVCSFPELDLVLNPRLLGG